MSDTHGTAADQDSNAAAPAVVRYPTAIAAGGGLAAAVGSSFIPMNAIEGFVSAYGIAELLPAAAPPLGNTARLALSAGIGTLTAGALLALLPRRETEEMGFETAVNAGSAMQQAPEATAATNSGFGATRLAGWLRALRFGKSEVAEDAVTDFADISRLRLRNSDQHPDAPARAPIMASSDLVAPNAPLGGHGREPVMKPLFADEAPAPLDLDPKMAFEASAADVAEEAIKPSLRFAPPVEAPELAEPEPDPLPMPEAPTVSKEEAVADAAMAEDEPALADIASEIEAASLDEDIAQPAQPQGDLDELGIGELLARLESGLARRRAQASGTQPFAPMAKADTHEASGRIISLGKPAGIVAHEPEAGPMPAATPQPLRFRLSKPDAETDFTHAEEGNLAGEPLPTLGDMRWNSEVEYQQPSLIGRSRDTDPFPDAKETETATPGDDDMDAALRDALATLRQLSDRQRNA